MSRVTATGQPRLAATAILLLLASLFACAATQQVTRWASTAAQDNFDLSSSDTVLEVSFDSTHLQQTANTDHLPTDTNVREFWEIQCSADLASDELDSIWVGLAYLKGDGSDPLAWDVNEPPETPLTGEETTVTSPDRAAGSYIIRPFEETLPRKLDGRAITSPALTNFDPPGESDTVGLSIDTNETNPELSLWINGDFKGVILNTNPDVLTEPGWPENANPLSTDADPGGRWRFFLTSVLKDRSCEIIGLDEARWPLRFKEQPNDRFGATRSPSITHEEPEFSRTVVLPSALTLGSPEQYRVSTDGFFVDRTYYARFYFNSAADASGKVDHVIGVVSKEPGSLTDDTFVGLDLSTGELVEVDYSSSPAFSRTANPTFGSRFAEEGDELSVFLDCSGRTSANDRCQALRFFLNGGYVGGWTSNLNLASDDAGFVFAIYLDDSGADSESEVSLLSMINPADAPDFDTNDQIIATVSSESMVFDELTTSSIPFLELEDPDAGKFDIELEFAVNLGNFSIASAGDVVVDYLVADGSEIRLTGVLADINALIADELRYHTPAIVTDTTVTITGDVSDLGNSAIGGASATTASLTFDFEVRDAANLPPTLVLPSGLVVVEDAVNSPIPGIVVDDPDSGVENLLLSLVARNGSTFSVNASSSTPPVVVTGTLGVDSEVTLQGNLDELNEWLSHLELTPPANFFETEHIVVVVDDLGNTGTTPANQVSDQFTVSILGTLDDIEFSTVYTYAPAAPSPPCAVHPCTTESTPLEIRDLQIVSPDDPVVEVTFSTTTDESGQFDLVGGAIDINVPGTAGVTHSSAGSTFVVTGLKSEVNSVINVFTFTPEPEFYGIATIAITLVEQGTPHAPRTRLIGMSVTVEGVTEGPIVDVTRVPSANLTGAEDTDFLISGVLVVDFDFGQQLTVTLTVSSGTVSLPDTTGLVVTNPSADVFEVVGPPHLVEAALGLIAFTPDPNFYGIVSLDIVATDSDSLSDSGSLSLNVGGTSDCVFITTTGVGATEVDEEDTLHVLGLEVLNQDPSAVVTATLFSHDASFGVLPAPGINVTNNNTHLVTIEGLSNDLFAALDDFLYSPDLHFFGEDIIWVGATDTNGCTAEQGIILVNVSNLPDVPVLTVGAGVSLDEGHDITLIAHISIDDPDARHGPETLSCTLSVTHGVISMADTVQLTPSSLPPADSLSFSGQEVAINSAFNLITYVPDEYFVGTDFLSVQCSDGLASDSATVQIDVINVEQAPVLTVSVPDPIDVDEDGSVVFTGISVLDKDYEQLTLTIEVDSGLASLVSVGPSVTAVPATPAASILLTGDEDLLNATLADGIRFVPDTHFTGTVLLQLTLSDGYHDDVVEQLVLNVVAQPDPPVLVLPGPQIVDEGDTLLIPYIDVTDLDGSVLSVLVGVSFGELDMLSTSAAITREPNGDIRITGFLDDIQSTLGSITYRSEDVNGTAVLRVDVDDVARPRSVNGTFDIVVVPTADFPILTTNVFPTSGLEDNDLTVYNVLVTDVDDGRSTVFLSVDIGQIRHLPAGSFGVSDVQAQYTVPANISFEYRPPAEFFGFFTVTVRAFDGILSTDLQSIILEVESVNDPPTLSVPDDPEPALQGQTQLLTPFAVTDPDGDRVVARFTVDSGILSVPNVVPSVVISGQNSAILSVTGFPNEVTDAIDTLLFSPDSLFFGNVTLEAEVEDIVSGAFVIGPQFVIMEVIDTNDPPVVNGPASLAGVVEEVTSGAMVFSVVDGDFNETITVELLAQNGVLALTGQVTGPSITLSGTVDEVNLALLPGVTFTGDTLFNGPTTILVAATDSLGLEDGLVVLIDVANAPNPPVIDLTTLSANYVVAVVGEPQALNGLSISDPDGEDVEVTVEIYFDNGTPVIPNEASLVSGTTSTSGGVFTIVGPVSVANGVSEIVSFIQYVPSPTFAGTTDRLYVSAQSIGDASPVLATFDLTLTPTNDEPRILTDAVELITLAGNPPGQPISYREGQTANRAVDGLALVDNDNDAFTITVTALDGGTLEFPSGGSAASYTGEDTTEVVLEGSAAQIALAFDSFIYKQAAATGGQVVRFRVNDGTDTTEAFLVYNVVATEDAPVVVASPTAYTVTVNEVLSFVNPFTTFADANLNDNVATFSVDTGGELNFPAVPISVTVTYTLANTVATLEGPMADVEQAVRAFEFVPTANFVGPVSLSIALADDGSLSDATATIAITVANTVTDTTSDLSSFACLASCQEDGDPWSFGPIVVVDPDVGETLAATIGADCGVYPRLRFGPLSQCPYITSTLDVASLNADLATLSVSALDSDANGLFAVPWSVNGFDQIPLQIEIAPLPDVPVLSLPAGLTVDQDKTLEITGITYTDADLNDVNTVTLSTTCGSLLLPNTDGLVVTGNPGNAITLVGLPGALASALDPIRFIAAASPSCVITVTATDPVSGAVSDTTSVSVNLLVAGTEPPTINIDSVAGNVGFQDLDFSIEGVLIEDADHVIGQDVTLTISLTTASGSIAPRAGLNAGIAVTTISPTSFSLFGTFELINTELTTGGVPIWTPNSGYFQDGDAVPFGSDAISFVVVDQDTNTGSGSVSLTIKSDELDPSAPTLALGASPTFLEDTSDNVINTFTLADANCADCGGTCGCFDGVLTLVADVGTFGTPVSGIAQVTAGGSGDPFLVVKGTFQELIDFVSASDNILWTPPTDYNGPAAIEVTIRDEVFFESFGTHSITVTPADDDFQWVAGDPAGTFDDGDVLRIGGPTLSSLDFDSAVDTVCLSVEALPAGVGLFRLDPSAAFAQADTFSATIDELNVLLNFIEVSSVTTGSFSLTLQAGATCGSLRNDMLTIGPFTVSDVVVDLAPELTIVDVGGSIPIVPFANFPVSLTFTGNGDPLILDIALTPDLSINYTHFTSTTGCSVTTAQSLVCSGTEAVLNEYTTNLTVSMGAAAVDEAVRVTVTNTHGLEDFVLIPLVSEEKPTNLEIELNITSSSPSTLLKTETASITFDVTNVDALPSAEVLKLDVVFSFPVLYDIPSLTNVELMAGSLGFTDDTGFTLLGLESDLNGIVVELRPDPSAGAVSTILATLTGPAAFNATTGLTSQMADTADITFEWLNVAHPVLVTDLLNPIQVHPDTTNTITGLFVEWNPINPVFAEVRMGSSVGDISAAAACSVCTIGDTDRIGWESGAEPGANVNVMLDSWVWTVPAAVSTPQTVTFTFSTYFTASPQASDIQSTTFTIEIVDAVEVDEAPVLAISDPVQTSPAIDGSYHPTVGTIVLSDANGGGLFDVTLSVSEGSLEFNSNTGETLTATVGLIGFNTGIDDLAFQPTECNDYPGASPAIILISVEDNSGLTTTEEILVTVPCDELTLVSPGDQSTPQDTPLLIPPIILQGGGPTQVNNVTVTLVDDTNADLTFGITDALVPPIMNPFQLSGTAEELNLALSSISFVPSTLGYDGVLDIEVEASRSTLPSDADMIAFTVTIVNDAAPPDVTLTGTPVAPVNEGPPIQFSGFTGFSLTDADFSDMFDLQITSSSPLMEITVVNGGACGNPAASSSISVSSLSLADAQTCISELSFSVPDHVNGAFQIEVSATDSFLESDAEFLELSIIDVNDLPTISIDPAITVDEDSSVTFASLAAAVVDEDNKINRLTISCDVLDGVIALSEDVPAAVLLVSDTDTTIVVDGAPALLAAVMQSVRFTPLPEQCGGTALVDFVVTDDATAATASDSVTVTVDCVDDAPILDVSLATFTNGVEGGIVQPITGVTVVDIDSAQVDVTLAVPYGRIFLDSVALVTVTAQVDEEISFQVLTTNFAAAMDEMGYEPPPFVFGDVRVSITVDDGTTAVSDFVDVTIDHVNHAPTLDTSAVGVLAGVEDDPYVVVADIAVTDQDNEDLTLTFALSPVTLDNNQPGTLSFPNELPQDVVVTTGAIDGSSSTVVLTGPPDQLTEFVSIVFFLKPSSGQYFNGGNELTVSVTDGIIATPLSNSFSITIALNPHAPSVADQSVVPSMPEDGAAAVLADIRYIEEDGEQVSVTFYTDDGLLRFDEGAVLGLTVSTPNDGTANEVTVSGSLLAYGFLADGSFVPSGFTTGDDLYFEPNPNFFGTAIIRITITDLTSGATDVTPQSEVKLYEFEVTPTDDAPVVDVSSVTNLVTTEGSTNLNILGASVSDIDETTVIVEVNAVNGFVSLPSTPLVPSVTVTGANDGTESSVTVEGPVDDVAFLLANIEYSPPSPDFSGTTQVCIEATDVNNALLTDLECVVVTVTGTADKPLITLPTVTDHNEDTSLTINGLAFAGTLPPTFLNVTLHVSHGTIDLPSSAASDSVFLFLSQADANLEVDSFTYQPAQHWCGTEILVIQVNAADDPLGRIGTVTWEVLCVNDPPTLSVGLDLTTFEETPISVTGVDIFDEDGSQEVLTVTLVVTAGVLSVPEDVGSFVVIVGDLTSAVTLTGAPQVIQAVASRFIYIPDDDFRNTDLLTVEVTDLALVSVSDSIDIFVTNVPDFPTIDLPVPGVCSSLCFGSAACHYCVDEDTDLDLDNIVIGDTDGELDDLVVTVTVERGTLNFDGVNPLLVTSNGFATRSITLSGKLSEVTAAFAAGTFQYRPDADYFGSDLLRINLDDQVSSTPDVDTEVRILIEAMPDDPVVSLPLTFTTTEETIALIEAVSVFDVDEGVTLQLTITANDGLLNLPTVIGLANNRFASNTVVFSGTTEEITEQFVSIEYLPNVDFPLGEVAGTDTLTVEARDDTGRTGTASCTVTVNPVPDAPVFDDTLQTYTGPLPEFQAQLVSGITVYDGDDDVLTLTVTVSNGALSVTASGAAVVTSLAADDSSIEIEGSVVDVSATLSNGVTYTPFQFFCCADKMLLSVVDDSTSALSASHVVSLSIDYINDEPVVSVPATLTVLEDSSTVISISAVDPDSTVNTIVRDDVFITVNNGTLSLVDPSGLNGGQDVGGSLELLYNLATVIEARLLTGILYEPDRDFAGSASLTVRMVDDADAALFAEETIAITVVPVNDDPVLITDELRAVFLVVEDSDLVISRLSLFDVDDVTLTLELTATQGEVFVHNQPGTPVVTITRPAGDNTVLRLVGDWRDINDVIVNGFLYTPFPNRFGDAEVVITVTDGSAATDSLTIPLFISAVTDAPILTRGQLEGGVPFLEDEGGRIVGFTVFDGDYTDLDAVVEVMFGAIELDLANTFPGDVVTAITPQQFTVRGLVVTMSDANAKINITGPWDEVSAAISSVNYTSPQDYNNINPGGLAGGAVTGEMEYFSVTIIDGLIQEFLKIPVNVTAVNDEVTLTAAAPVALTTDEDVDLAIVNLDLNDVDGGPVSVRLRLAEGSGSLFFPNADTGTVTIVTPASLNGLYILSGPVDDVADALANFTYSPLEDLNFEAVSAPYAQDSVIIRAIDNDLGTAQQVTLTVVVEAVNDAPTMTLPGTLPEIDEDILTALDGFVIDDIDYFENPNYGALEIEVTVVATNGFVRFLHDTLPSTIICVEATNTGCPRSFVIDEIEITGSIEDVNEFINLIAFVSAADYSGPASLEFTINDQGNFGKGVGVSVVTLEFEVNPVNDPPVLRNDQAILFLDAAFVDINVTSNDQDSDIPEHPFNFDTLSIDLVPENTFIEVIPARNAIRFSAPADTVQGLARFSYTICDLPEPSEGLSFACAVDAAEVLVLVNPSVDGLFLNDDLYIGHPNENQFNVCPDCTIDSEYSSLLLADQIANIGQPGGLTPIDVMNNDFAVDLDQEDGRNQALIDRSALRITTNPGSGTATIDGDNNVIYIPALAHFGEDTFEYEVCTVVVNGTRACGLAWAVIFTERYDDPPQVTAAVDATVQEDTPQFIDLYVTGEVYDQENRRDVLAYEMLEFPVDLCANQQCGSLLFPLSCNYASCTCTDFESTTETTAFEQCGQLMYVPNLDLFGTDKFNYRVRQEGYNDSATHPTGTLESQDSRVDVTIESVNDQPTVQNATAETVEDTSTFVEFYLFGSDVDVTLIPGMTLTFQIESASFGGEILPPAQVTVTHMTGDPTLFRTGPWRYRPKPNFDNIDVIEFSAQDNEGLKSVFGIIEIDVAPLPDPVVALDFSTVALQDQLIEFILPVGDNDTRTTYNTTDDIYEFVIISQGDDGTANVIDDALGIATYRPFSRTATNVGDVVVDTFTYQVFDLERGTSDIGTVTVTISYNFPPVAEDDTVTVLEDGVVTFTIEGDDTDGPLRLEGGVSVTYSVVAFPDIGDFTELTADSRSWRFEPDPDFFTTRERLFQFQVSDGLKTDIGSVNIVVEAVDDAPDAEDTEFCVIVNNNQIFRLPANDRDNEDSLLTCHVAGLGLNVGDSRELSFGNLTRLEDEEALRNCQFIYEPLPDMYGDDTFSYFVVNEDNVAEKTSTTAQVVISVQSNDPPEANNTQIVYLDEDTDIEFILDVFDPNLDATSDAFSACDELSYTILSGLTVIGNTLSPEPGVVWDVPFDNRISFSPLADWFGEDTFRYRVTDSEPSSDNGRVTFVVRPVDDPPVARDQSFTIISGTSLVVDLFAEDVDNDFEIVITPDNFPSFAANHPEDDTFSLFDWPYEDDPFRANYVSNISFGGVDSFTYEVVADNNVTVSGVITFTMNLCGNGVLDLEAGEECDTTNSIICVDCVLQIDGVPTEDLQEHCDNVGEDECQTTLQRQQCPLECLPFIESVDELKGIVDNDLDTLDRVKEALISLLECGESADISNEDVLLVASNLNITDLDDSTNFETDGGSFTIDTSDLADLNVECIGQTQSEILNFDDTCADGCECDERIANVHSLTFHDTVTGEEVEFSSTVTFTLQLTDEYRDAVEEAENNSCDDTEEVVPECVFFDPSTGCFSTEGCTRLSFNDQEVNCECTHLTDFSVVFSGGEGGDGGCGSGNDTFEPDYIFIMSAVAFGVSMLVVVVVCVCYHIYRNHELNEERSHMRKSYSAPLQRGSVQNVYPAE